MGRFVRVFLPTFPIPVDEMETKFFVRVGKKPIRN